MANRLWQIGIWQKGIWRNVVFPNVIDIIKVTLTLRKTIKQSKTKCKNNNIKLFPEPENLGKKLMRQYLLIKSWKINYHEIVLFALIPVIPQITISLV